MHWSNYQKSSNKKDFMDEQEKTEGDGTQEEAEADTAATEEEESGEGDQSA